MGILHASLLTRWVVNFFAAQEGKEDDMKKGWTRRSYRALFNWTDERKRPAVKKILLADGLDDVVARLEASKTLGEWCRIASEAAAAVGPDVVEASAVQADKELNVIADKHRYCSKCGYGWQAKAKNPKQCPNCKSMHWRG